MHKLGELGRTHLALVRFLSGVESQVGLEIAGAAKSLVANLQCGEGGRGGRQRREDGDQKVKSCQGEVPAAHPHRTTWEGKENSLWPLTAALGK